MAESKIPSLFCMCNFCVLHSTVESALVKKVSHNFFVLGFDTYK